MRNRLILMLIGGGFLAVLCAQPAAVIAVAEGNATVTTAEQHPHPAHSLDWLPAGAVLEAAPGTRLVLAFANGRRYELGSGGKVSITLAAGPARRLRTLARIGNCRRCRSCR